MTYMDRVKHIWNVTLADENGGSKEVEYQAYWDPSKVEADEVARACAAELSIANLKADRKPVIGLKAELVS